MDIGFFFKYNNQLVQMPVNPERVTATFSGNNSTNEVIKLGEINILKDRKLASIEFESFCPSESWFSAVRTKGNFKKPEFYKKFFLDIYNSKKPVRLTITGINIDMQVSIENFEYYHQAGDHEDMYYSLELKEYKEYYITRIPVSPSLKRPTAPATPPKPTTPTTPPKPTTPTTPATPSTPTKITVGCTVIVNGRLHYDSYGSKPGQTLTKYKGKINFINMDGTHPYHIATMSGSWLGWVTKESVVIA